MYIIICKKYKDVDVVFLKTKIYDKFSEICNFLCNEEVILINDFLNVLKHIEKMTTCVKKSKLINKMNKHVLLKKFI